MTTVADLAKTLMSNLETVFELFNSSQEKKTNLLSNKSLQVMTANKVFW